MCAGKFVQGEVCCVSMTGFDTTYNVTRCVNIHRATTQVVPKGHQHISVKGAQSSSLMQASIGSSLGGIFSGAAAAASLAVASQIPLWFCITCPIVLGMLFPFAFNFGLGAMADELCTYYNLPADACTQLW